MSEQHPGSSVGFRIRGLLVLSMGCLAVAAPFFAGSAALFLVGLLLIVCGVAEMLEIFRVGGEQGRRSAYLSGILSILAGGLLLGEPRVVLGGARLFLGGSFAIDGVGKLVAALRSRSAGSAWAWRLAIALANLFLGLVLLLGWPVSGLAITEILVGVRMLTAGWSILLGRAAPAGEPEAVPQVGVHPDGRLRLLPRPELAALEAGQQAEEDATRWSNAYWCWTFVLVFFAIHIGRMKVEWNAVGMISPLVAVAGDVGTALVLSYALILPCRLMWRMLTRPVERRAWERRFARADAGRGAGLLGGLSTHWLDGRLRFARRLAQMRRSPRTALRWGLQVGLPAAAILIAVNPIWGFSWFFNSESWATEVWNRWAEARTDTWREQMILAVEERYSHMPRERLFQVEPAGVAKDQDFSFIVIGDTGEGGAAQHALRDQYLFLGKRPDIKFLVVSSDVIYPVGAMSDYEPKFYLPFKGFTKPIYAIPGNHDWYDALEGFAANFLEADAARACMLARIDSDGRLTSTTEGRVDRLIQEAARLRREFGVSTGWQRGPFFDVQAERFALIAVDTGVLKSVDSKQWAWLKAALERSRGKFTMVILGHPLYAGGRYQGGADGFGAGEWVVEPHAPLPEALAGTTVEPFAAIHRLLREYQVPVVMAGDTHYFEHYVENYRVDDRPRRMYHFVNGGGGAYISIGTPLDWPTKPAVADCAFFPRIDFVTAKLDRDMPQWKKPLWWWVKHFRGWPLTAESLAGAFDYSRAPYFQSFVEVRVEGSANRVRLIPHGANGPLSWRDLQAFGAVLPEGKTGDDAVEFVVPMAARVP